MINLDVSECETMAKNINILVNGLRFSGLPNSADAVEKIALMIFFDKVYKIIKDIPHDD